MQTTLQHADAQGDLTTEAAVCTAERARRDCAREEEKCSSAKKVKGIGHRKKKKKKTKKKKNKKTNKTKKNKPNKKEESPEKPQKNKKKKTLLQNGKARGKNFRVTGFGNWFQRQNSNLHKERSASFHPAGPKTPQALNQKEISAFLSLSKKPKEMKKG